MNLPLPPSPEASRGNPPRPKANDAGATRGLAGSDAAKGTGEVSPTMKRRHFVGLAGGALVVAGSAAYLLGDRKNLVRADFPPATDARPLEPDEARILFLASLAPSGHNTQPWFVHRLEPYRWIVGNDRRRWLPAVDPQQRETILSLGAFLENLEQAAISLGYACRWTLLAATNQDARVMEVALARSGAPKGPDVERLKSRRTLRRGFRRDDLSSRDVARLIGPDPEFIHYLPANRPAGVFVATQTIEANRRQAARAPAREELADWIRWSGADARQHRDGLTTGGMEIDGVAGWVVRNFYGRASALKADFGKRSLAQVREQVSASAGWILITSADSSVAALLATGRRMQRLFLQVRERSIGLHPMTQILEEDATRQALPSAVGLGTDIQFILRVGYVADYPPPVSLRRPVAWLLRDPPTGEPSKPS